MRRDGANTACVIRQSTSARLEQGTAYLAARGGKITVADLIAMTRFHSDAGPSICAHAVPEYRIESSGACIMSPETREMWAVWGNPCSNPYERFCVGEEQYA